MLNAPDTNPDVVPTPMPSSSGWWSSVGALLGLLVDVLPLLPELPDPWPKWLPVIGAVAGLILNRFFRPSYQAVKERVV